MASVREVYNALKDMANKDERGFVTPSEFNSFAPIAQTNVFNKIFERIVAAGALRKRGIDPGRDKSTLKQAKEDLAAFVKTATITKNNSGVFPKPDDLAKVISVRTYGDVMLDVSTSSTVAVEHDYEKFQYVMSSSLSKPTESAPVAFFGEEMLVYPSSILKVILTYYKQPEGISPITGQRSASVPKLGFTVLNNKETYQASSSIDFELPEHYVPELVEEMARLIGINLRDADIYTYAETQSQKR